MKQVSIGKLQSDINNIFYKEQKTNKIIRTVEV